MFYNRLMSNQEKIDKERETRRPVIKQSFAQYTHINEVRLRGDQFIFKLNPIY